MKYARFTSITTQAIGSLAVAMIALAATSARGDVAGGEIVGGEIVGGEIVHGDVAGGEIVRGEIVHGEIVHGEVVGGEPAGGEIISGEHLAPSTSYVGDMPSCDAGVSCSGGSCGGQSCHGGCSGGHCGGGFLASLLGGQCGGGSGGGGQVIGRSYGRPDLFYNYYTQGYANRTNAQMYLSPLPIPPNVGHTYYTYQPWYPHHMLYRHKDKYHRYYDSGRGMNRTRAVYFSPPIRQAASNLYWNYLRIPR